MFDLYKAGNNAIDYYFCYNLETGTVLCIDCDLNDEEVKELYDELLMCDTVEDVEKMCRVDFTGWKTREDAFEDLWGVECIG